MKPEVIARKISIKQICFTNTYFEFIALNFSETKY